jgi:hypothetical protein
MEPTIAHSQLPKSRWAAVILGASFVGLLVAFDIFLGAGFSADHTGLYTVSHQIIATLIACAITALDVPALREMRKMRRGVIRKSGKDSMLFALVLNSLSLLIIVFSILMMLETRHHDETIGLRDEIINDINNICANAYQYRIHPVSEGGGGGSYAGFRLPPKMSENRYARYTIVVSPDSVLITGTSFRWGPETTVTATVDSEGHMHSIRYTGKFEEQY